MLEQIKELVADKLGADAEAITEKTSFKEDLGADSLDLFEMVMAFEEEFEVELLLACDFVERRPESFAEDMLDMTAIGTNE